MEMCTRHFVTAAGRLMETRSLAHRLLEEDAHGTRLEEHMKIAGEQPPAPWQPLGERVMRPQPLQPEWKPLAHAPCIEVNRQGQLRTNLPLPK